MKGDLSTGLARSHFASHLPKKQWLRVGEAAEHIGFGESFVYKLLDSGSLHGHKHNAATGKSARWRIRTESVLIYLMDTADYQASDFLQEILRLIERRSPAEIDFLLSELAAARKRKERIA